MAGVEEYRATFEMVDVNGDGFISPEELKGLMRTLGEDVSDTRIVEIVVEADLNHDGKISLEEFAAMMERHRGRG
ncbi:EF-hand domain-containing protein [Spirillospora sp. CA-294931]|uniref:EF-hand domain-containing protein n=1 Tax=Spirillospora sp. CA-294931 TaxID=3240042 RepID=UPI003D91386E